MQSDVASKKKGLMWLIGACLLGAAFALGISPLAHVIPWSWEKKLGYVINPSFEKSKCESNIQAQASLKKLVQRIYPLGPEDNKFPVQVKVVYDPIVNAYAALGGEITVNSGLLRKTESPEELAGVLAHEIEHVHHRHIMQGVITRLFTTEGLNIIFGSSSTGEWARYFLNMDFTRAQEKQADREGLSRLQKAHVDNRGFERFFERMEEDSSIPVFISDHPSNSARMEMVSQFENRDVTPIMSDEEWKLFKTKCSE